LVVYRASLLRYDPVRGWQVRQQTPTFVTAAYPYVAGFSDSGWYNTTTGARASLINHFVISTPADAAHRQYYAVQYDISWAARSTTLSAALFTTSRRQSARSAPSVASIPRCANTPSSRN